MNLVFDTDVLSTFGKIRRLDLLKELFPHAGFFIPLTSNEVRVLITEIEREDRVTIKDRDDILTESGDND
jgi:hypothetical protein